MTAGFIRSQEPVQSAHFDVIIYDQIEAPILWIEVNKDKSESGRARIIPAEHVRAIIEVKSSFSRRTVRDATTKLRELEPLMDVDDPQDCYPKYLPTSAFVAMVFFELRAAERFDIDALNLVRDFELRRPFYGAVILRGEALDPNATGIIQKVQSQEPIPRNWHDVAGLLHQLAMGDSAELNGRYIATTVMWLDVNFSRFAFDLLALLNGTYRAGFLSSFHGLNLHESE